MTESTVLKAPHPGIYYAEVAPVVRKRSPLVTIITVVRNGGDVLEDTIRSVVEQSYDNIEYIVIDGCSSDGTLDVIRKYDAFIHIHISEKDKGIYDAMNKGIALASGDWINFLNAGDTFANNDVLTDIGFSSRHCDILYGGTIHTYSMDFTRITEPASTDYRKTMPFVHQSSFVKTALMKKYMFNDAQFRLIADKYFFLSVANDGATFENVGVIISNCDADGISSRFSWRIEYEHFLVRRRFNRASLPYQLMHLPLRILINVLKTLLPAKLINQVRRRLD